MHDDGRERTREQLRRPAPRDRAKVGGEVYELVGDAERVDRDWEDENARQCAADWEAGRAERLAVREAQRRRSTLGARLDTALLEIERGKGVRARPIAATRRSGEDDSPGGRQPTQVDGPEIERALQLIQHHVEMIEGELDAELGLRRQEPIGDTPGQTGAATAARMMQSEERDRIVWEQFHGIRADQVASEAPYLGTSARTIERAREREARRRGVMVRLVDGTVVDEPRRVVIDQQAA